jgi:putative transcriptional regulator
VNRANVIIGFGLGLIAGAACGQEAGSLLVASERLEDDAFRETVVLLVHHAEEGSVGVAINRPTWVTTRDVFPRLDYLHSYRGDVFHGGPLAQATVLVMTRGLPPGDDARPLIDDVYMHSNLDAIEDTFDRRRHDPSALRFFAGHASWGPGQLEEELASGAWTIVPGAAALIFDPDPATLWRRLSDSGSNLTVHEREPVALPRAIERLIVSR